MVFVFLTDIAPQRRLNSDNDQSVVVDAAMQTEKTRQAGVLDKSKDLLKYRLEEADVGNVKRAIVDSPPRQCVGIQTEDDFQFKEVIPDVFIYSAFFDIRNNDFEGRENGSAAIRMMTIMPSKMKGDYPTLYCLGMLKAGQHWSSQVTYYEMCENHNRHYGGYILSCRLPKDLWQTPPCSVLVSSSTVPTNNSQWLNVHSAVKTRKHKFEVCVPPLFGKIDEMDLIEFIELARIFGAERIHFYNYKMSHSILAVLLYYRKRGIVSVLPWKLDDRLKQKKQLHYNGQSTNIQDCLYRNMFSTRYLAFMDVDEMVVPRNHSSWFSMITSVKNYSQHAGFSINSVFFDPNWSQEGSSSEVSIKHRVTLHRLTNIVRTKQLSRYRTKCMVNPRRIFEIGIHHVSKPVVASLETVKLPEEFVLLHHYRICDHRFGMKCQDRITDTILLAYASQLERAVKRVLATLLL